MTITLYTHTHVSTYPVRGVVAICGSSGTLLLKGLPMECDRTLSSNICELPTLESKRFRGGST